jgi:hypothetical protein
VFADDGGSALSSGTAPYTGTFTALEALDGLDGFEGYGALDTWTLQIVNNGNSEGTLESFSVLFYWDAPSA